MDFDFTTHLSKLLSIPPNQITIQVLTGGLLNAAVRASFTPPVDLTRFGHPQSVRSVVLKYAPPYMVSEPWVPLNTIRQDIEARALVLLDPNSESALPVSSLFTKYPNVKTSRLIHHDSENRVLIMTDLGSSVVTIDDWLTQEPAPLPEDVEHIAKDLGRFLGEFVIATSRPSVELLSFLQLPSNSALIHQFDGFVENSLKVVLQGVPDVDILIKRVKDAARDSMNTDSCLGMVDIWRKNIVIDSDKNICLLDWEQFGWSNASCEMSQLGVFSFLFIYIRSISIHSLCTQTVQSMHWILLKSSFTDAVKNRTNAFISTMLQYYGQARGDVPSPDFRRQALVFYGRETLSLLKWNADEFDDTMKERALELGLAYLRAANTSVDTMDESIFDSDSETLAPYERLFEKAREILAAR